MGEISRSKAHLIRPPNQTEPRGAESVLSSLLLCTTGRRVPASSTSNQGDWKERFAPTLTAGGQSETDPSLQPAKINRFLKIGGLIGRIRRGTN